MASIIYNVCFPVDYFTLLVYGDGRDGSQTVATSTTTTLTRDWYPSTLSVYGTLVTNGYKVFARDNLTVRATGVIDNPGGGG